jgi:hypothetical protein
MPIGTLRQPAVTVGGGTGEAARLPSGWDGFEEGGFRLKDPRRKLKKTEKLQKGLLKNQEVEAVSRAAAGNQSAPAANPALPERGMPAADRLPARAIRRTGLQAPGVMPPSAWR